MNWLRDSRWIVVCVCVCVQWMSDGGGGEERINHGLFGFHRIGHYPPVLFMLKDCLIG